MFGLLNINKPAGVTSRTVVNHVQRFVRPEKVGHAGTLDPLATGVLLVCVGPATRLVPYAQALQKVYRATFLLGRTSCSDDTEEEVTLLENAPVPSPEEVERVLPRFVGQISQRPPQFSALKVGGKRAYALARAGQQVKMQPRVVRVDRIQVLEYTYPQLSVEVTCGSGTYIRSLGRDIGESLQTGAVMSQLTRTAIGPFDLSAAWPIDTNRRLSRTEVEGQLIAARKLVADLPETEVTGDELSRLAAGLPISRPGHGWQSEIAAIDCAGRLVALLAVVDERQVRPIRNFPSPDPS